MDQVLKQLSGFDSYLERKVILGLHKSVSEIFIG